MQVRIVQVFRVEREIIVETEFFEEDDIDTPSFDDPRWTSKWSLENEEQERIFE